MKMKFFLGFVALFYFSSCKVKIVPSSNDMPPLHGEFQITSFKDFSNPSSKLRINFDSTSKQVSGFAGCNRFFGAYETEGNNLAMKQLSTTRKACTDGKPEVEQALLETLESVNFYTLENENLNLKNKQGKTIVSAKPYVFEMDKDYKLTYKTSSMLGTQTIEHSNNVLTCKEFKNEKNQEPIIKKLSDQENKDILDAVAELPFESLNSLEAPSNQRHVDGAWYGRLSLKYNGKEYEVPDFDHGNPPSELARVMNLLMSKKPCE